MSQGDRSCRREEAMDSSRYRCRQRIYRLRILGDKASNKDESIIGSRFRTIRYMVAQSQGRKVHACMEATGGWSEELAYFLQERGHVVSIVNPMQIRAFGQSELSRTKTDKADAALIARFCAGDESDRVGSAETRRKTAYGNWFGAAERSSKCERKKRIAWMLRATENVARFHSEQ